MMAGDRRPSNPESRFRLRIQSEILSDRALDLPLSTSLVGRDRQAQIRVDDPSISRFHARVVPRGHELLLVDLGSTNGTYVNDVRVKSPTLVLPGSQIRFGRVQCTLELVVEPKKGSASPLPSSAEPQATRSEDRVDGASSRIDRTSIAARLAIAIFLLGVAGWLSLRSDPEVAPHEPEREVRTRTGGAPPLDSAADSKEEPAQSGFPVAVDSTPKPDPQVDAPPEIEPPGTEVPLAEGRLNEATIRLRKGRTLLGEIIDMSDPLTVLIHETARSAPARVATEEILEIDGKPWTYDRETVVAARLDLADDSSKLVELARWYDALGLPAERDLVARHLLAREPENALGHGFLGHLRYLGSFLSRKELAERELLGPDGMLIGEEADVRRVRAFYLDLYGRPPLEFEHAQAIALLPEMCVDELLNTKEHWAWWIASELELVLGRPDATRVAASLDALAAELLQGHLSFRDAWKRMAEAPEIAVRLPERAARGRALLIGLLGPAAAQDRAILESAERMAAGQRVAIFGERGSSLDDLVGILLRQPRFFQAVLARSSRALLGAELPQDELLKAALGLAASPKQLVALQREWLISSRRLAALTRPRPLTQGQLARSLIVHRLGRLPSPDEAAALETALAGFMHPPDLRLVTGLALEGAPAPPGIALASTELASWVRCRFLFILGREPTSSESAAFADALATGRATRPSVEQALLASADSLHY